jgi:hypothetical protein
MRATNACASGLHEKWDPRLRGDGVFPWDGSEGAADGKGVFFFADQGATLS